MKTRIRSADTGAGSELGPCPRCGKCKGEISDAGSGRFRYLAYCPGCGFTTESVRVRGVAVKLWNEAKLAAGASKPKRRRWKPQ
jgi:hypothetical protein